MPWSRCASAAEWERRDFSKSSTDQRWQGADRAPRKFQPTVEGGMLCVRASISTACFYSRALNIRKPGLNQGDRTFPNLADEEKFPVRPIEAVPSVNRPPSEISLLLELEQPLPIIT